MRFIKDNICLLIILILLGIIIIQNTFKNPHKPEPTITEIPTYVVSHVNNGYKPVPNIIIKRDTIKINKIKTKVKWKVKWKAEKLDSIKIKELYEKYYEIKVYNDIIIEDSNLTVKVTDTVTQNEITSRHVSWDIKPIIYEKTIIEPPRLKLYVGLGIGGGVNQFGFSPKLFLQDRKSHVYTFSYNILTGYTEVSVGWLIRFRKKSK